MISPILVLSCVLASTGGFIHDADNPCSMIELPQDVVRTASKAKEHVRKCLRLNECSVLNELVLSRPPGFLDFLKQSVCASSGRLPLYCCPPSADFLPQYLLISSASSSEEAEDEDRHDERDAEPEFGVNSTVSEEVLHDVIELPVPSKLVNNPPKLVELADDSIVFEDDEQLPRDLVNKNSRGNRGRGKIFFFDSDRRNKSRPGRVIFKDNDLPAFDLKPLPTKPPLLPAKPLSTKPPLFPVKPLVTKTPKFDSKPSTDKPLEVELVDDHNPVIFDNEINDAPALGVVDPKISTTAKPDTGSATVTPPRSGKIDIDPLEMKKTLLPNTTAEPYFDRCGITGFSRIVGGTDAGPGKYTWMARLGYKFSGESGDVSFRCGGAVINSRYVLTAAHCVPKDGSKLVVVRFGQHDETKDAECEGSPLCTNTVKDIEVEAIIPHADYNKPMTLQNDIALIRMKDQIDTEDYRPICLPFDLDSRVPRQINSKNDSVELVAAGWGSLGSGRGSSSGLQEVILPVFDQEKCTKAYKGKVEISDLQVCAGGTSGKDSCEGDSGGPLMMRDDQGYHHVLGVVSFGPRLCGTAGLPGVYTRVTRYLRWILETIEP